MRVALLEFVRMLQLHGFTRLGVFSAALIALVIASEARPGAEARSGSPAAEQAKPAPRRKSPPKKAYEEYQVPAGNTLPIELRSRLSSSTSQAFDNVEGKLLRPILADGVELVPAGATVIGTVTEAEPAGEKKPGKLAFRFNVIEHPETGSRAMIKASVLTFESQPPAKGNIFPDVVLEKGRDASVLLLGPLLVRLPIE